MATRSGNSHRVSNGIQRDFNVVKGAVVSMADRLKKESKKQSHNVVEKAKKHPAACLGIAAGVGLVLGLLLKK